MSYRDPYTGQYVSGSNNEYHHNTQPQYAQQPETYHNPYTQQQQSYNTQGNSGSENYYQDNSRSHRYQDSYPGPQDQPYRDEYDGQPGYNHEHGHNQGAQNQASYHQDPYEQPSYNYPPVQRRPTQKSLLSRKNTKVSVIPVKGEVGFDKGEFTPPAPMQRSRTPSAYRKYRYDHQGNLWAKGGRARAVGRVCFCTVLTTLFLIVSIILALVLWIKPPNVQLGKVQTMTTNGSPVTPQANGGFQVQLGVNISVNNFNYFDVDFKKIDAQVFYPIDNVPVGGGLAKDVNFKGGQQTNITFPFQLMYQPSNDPSGKVLSDLLAKCGTSRQNIILDYKIKVSVRVLLVTISPTISNQFNFPCPIQLSDISKVVGKIGG